MRKMTGLNDMVRGRREGRKKKIIFEEWMDEYPFLFFVDCERERRSPTSTESEGVVGTYFSP